MSGYTKLFSSILTSSVWTEPTSVRICWITMLALANQHGEVEAAVPGLARTAGVTLEEAKQALEILAAPDPWSRTKEHDGRRIEAMDGGWLILNHAKYRRMCNLEERKERDAERKRRARAKGSRPFPQSPIPSEAEAEAEAASRTRPDISGRVRTSADACGQVRTEAENTGHPVTQRDMSQAERDKSVTSKEEAQPQTKKNSLQSIFNEEVLKP